MAHLLDTAPDGRAAFVSHRTPAWHHLGTVVEDAPTAAEALQLAHLDWQVTLEPVMAGDDHLAADRYRATVRTSPWNGEREVLGVVGTSYRPIQNADAFAWLDALLDDGQVRIETAGALRGGRSIFISTYLPDDLVVDPGGVADPVRQYVLATNSHDGSTALRGLITPTRVVCANTEAVALRNAKAKVSIQHRSGATGQLTTARQVLGLAATYNAAWAELATSLARTELTDQAWEDFLTRCLVPDAKEGAPAVGKARVDDKRAEVAGLYRGEANQAIAGTAWGAFNAWTEYLDHYRPTREDSGVDGPEAASARLAALGTAQVDAAYTKDKTAAWVTLERYAAAATRLDPAAAMASALA